jgi:ZIP family zinc transporter
MYTALLLTVIAGLGSGVGGILSVLSKKKNVKFLSVALGFSAGVMVYVAFAELYDEANRSLIDLYGNKMGTITAVISFFAGILVIAIIDKLIPEKQNPHEFSHITTEKHLISKLTPPDKTAALKRTGFVTAIALTVHNLPEGLATFISALKDPKIALPVAFAITLHNIPEGIAVAMPIYYSTGNRKKSVFYAFISGIAEPVGAIIGYIFLRTFISDTLFGIVFGVVAGIMVFISIDELLPSAREYGEHHLSIYGFVFGMLVMAVSLVLLG